MQQRARLLQWWRWDKLSRYVFFFCSSYCRNAIPLSYVLYIFNKVDSPSSVGVCLSDKEFKCDYDSCIPFKWVCDGEDDCKDGSDEHLDLCRRNGSSISSTTSGPCLYGQFQCISGECLEEHKLCDGHPDCQDYSDEGNKCELWLFMDALEP